MHSYCIYKVESLVKSYMVHGVESLELIKEYSLSYRPVSPVLAVDIKSYPHSYHMLASVLDKDLWLINTDNEEKTRLSFSHTPQTDLLSAGQPSFISQVSVCCLYVVCMCSVCVECVCRVCVCVCMYV